MKRLGLMAIAIMIAASGMAQMNGSKRMGDKNHGSHQNEYMHNNKQKSDWDNMKTDKFIESAVMGGMMEMQLGMLAEKKAKSPEVEKLGKKMAKNHGNATEELRNIAGKMNVDVPMELDQSHQKQIDALKNKSGEAFKKAFVQTVIQSHEKAISNFENADHKVSSDKIEDWIDQTLPKMKEHLSMAENIENNMKGAND